MSNLSIPTTGIPIQHTRADSKEPPQIIRLALAEKDTRDLLKHVREGGNTRLKTGLHRLAIEYGTNRVSLRFGTDKHPQEIFEGPADGSKPRFFAGKLSHTLEQLQAKEATAGMDTALEKLKNNLKQAQDERDGSTVNKLLKPQQHRPSPLGAGLLGSRPSSPFLKAGFSPHSGPTSAPLLAGPSKQEQTKLNAIRIPVVHLLATEPQEARKLMEKLRVKQAELDQVLLKVAKDGKGGLKELKDRSFRDLDVWKFPYQSQQDRQSAIDHAIAAFDRQRIDKGDSLWQMLLAKEDRGKGISLSKLNFDKPIASGNLTPKVLERSTDGGSTEGKSLNSLGSSQSDQKGKAPVAKQTNKPKTVDQIVRSLKTSGKESGRNTPTTKENKKAPPASAPKQEVKFKSSEKIVDSDEEADAGPAIAATSTAKREQAKQAKEPKPVRPERPSATASKPTLHKLHLSGESDRGRLTPSSTMVKTRGGKDTGSGEVKGQALTPSQSRNPSRPRNGSSPAKPSPLGSSPPTNLRDVDSTSNSSKGTAISSAPSSPPSNANSSQAKKKNHQPAAAEKNANNLVNGVKRKADDYQSAPPAKKVQVNGTSTKNDLDRFNSLPKALSDEIARLPKHDSSESDASSVSDKVITKEQLIEDARRFHKYYAKYKALHEKVNNQKASERKDEDVDRVWTMHKRLQEVKDRIWRDWARLEKMDNLKT
ncbi:hypothetical protein LTR70_000515 [Exophiala xenobiotica]|uniref:RING-type E3 ubiquitin transferase n=1 Tax=Lithohypha guttulata TaxID=1690604 RepID=A0ABR0KB88_9EURO|nr:hypothetical protein LTR24_004678 [Lithohypha guttulata]KAK5329366.1 hypothetical protein LTR70_000515 [Exophiala xenobiotica]